MRSEKENISTCPICSKKILTKNLKRHQNTLFCKAISKYTIKKTL